MNCRTCWYFFIRKIQYSLLFRSFDNIYTSLTWRRYVTNSNGIDYEKPDKVSQKREEFKRKNQRRWWKIRKKERECERERKWENYRGKERWRKQREAVVGEERIKDGRWRERGRKRENNGGKRKMKDKETVWGRRKNQRGKEESKEEKERINEGGEKVDERKRENDWGR